MKRKLNKEEIEATKKGIERLQKTINETTEAKEYAEKKMEFLKKTWEFEDYERPIYRKNTIEINNNKIKECNSIIKSSEINLKELKKQLKEGVEVKKPAGV